jgi:3-oxoacyl-[acyl-carrier-protein] synthase II
MRAALASAGRQPHEIQYINAHGTGTRLNDEAEVEAIKQVFGDSTSQLWVSTTKPATGHIVAAAGVIEAAITLMTLDTGIIFPTLNLEQPDPALDLNFVAGQAQHHHITCAMSNSFGLGGQTSSVVLSAPDTPRHIASLNV